MWTPINKKTKHRYPPITDAEKAKWLEDKHIRERYVFEWVKPSELDEFTVPNTWPMVEAELENTEPKKDIPEPIEAKKTKTAKTKE